MSRLTDFAASGFALARGVIGGESLSINGGDAISAVIAEVERTRSYESGGYDQVVTLDAVVSLADWLASYAAGDSTYFGKPATARSQTFRVSTIRRGASFVTVRLTSEKKGA